MWGGKLGNGCESSPKPTRKPFNSSNEELQSVPKMNGDQGSVVTSSELEAFKQDILREMRKEINKMKQDIIDCKYKILTYIPLNMFLEKDNLFTVLFYVIKARLTVSIS